VFSKFKGLHQATTRLQSISLPPAEAHVLPETAHGNFCDVVWWFPAWVLRKVYMSGKADPIQVENAIQRDLTRFNAIQRDLMRFNAI